MPEEITFANVLKNPIYKDRDVLYALHPPEGLLHRTEQKNELIMELAPILMNSAVSGIFVYGNPGTGKTSLVLELIEKLEKEAKKNKIELKKAYVNCSEKLTFFRTNISSRQLSCRLSHENKDSPSIVAQMTTT